MHSHACMPGWKYYFCFTFSHQRPSCGSKAKCMMATERTVLQSEGLERFQA